ncbi:phage repressor protein CI [Citrobacter portucalensis]|nr:phage repressor protein CI [Citrobacter portucalensis]MDN4386138.1 phage repressor protein CI [Citrobacter portucalensis]MDN4406502.1 phage repressor protein CI [Citrobacter portucalensis]MDN4446049.1 phage repressor protein CI [Citrobacter portucalensis]
MGDLKEKAQAVLSRMREAYGVKTNVEFSELLNIPQPTISNWIARGNVPLRYVMDCSKDTGKDLDWLLSGQLANLSCDTENGIAVKLDGKVVFEKILNSGGKAVLQRLLDAYGFSMQKELGDMLGLSSGTISTWIRRDYFPGDVVVACALSTGVSLKWLATGEGNKHDGNTPIASPNRIPSYTLNAGKLINKDEIEFDKSLIAADALRPIFISGINHSWVVDFGLLDITNGVMLLEIDNVTDIYNVIRLPGNRIQLSLYNSPGVFECSIDDVKSLGRTILIIEQKS